MVEVHRYQILLASLEARDEAAWQDFLQEFGDLILAIPTRMGLPRQDVEDVFQRTCVRILERAGTVRDPSRLSSWVYGIALHLSLDARRANVRRRESERAEWMSGPPHEPVPVEELARLEDAALVRDLLARLDERCRRLLSMLHLESPRRSYREIAEAEGIPVGSIGPTQARCLEKMEKLMDEVSTGVARQSKGPESKTPLSASTEDDAESGRPQ